MPSELVNAQTNAISKEQVKYPTFCQLMKNWEKTDYTTMFQN